MAVTAETMSRARARRMAVAAQGLNRARPRRVGLRHVTDGVRRMGTVQIDSVNVLTRSQYLPVFARLGPYDRALLRRAAEARPRRITEYWAHQASFVPVEILPLFRWRMADHEREAWGSIRAAGRDPALVAEVLAAVADLGPITPGGLSEALGRSPRAVRDHWGWNWNDVKAVTEFLFFTGSIAVAGRTGSFERLCDVPQRVLPATVLAAPTPSPEDAHRELVRIAARAHGVATVRCLADYWRTRTAPTRTAVEELVAEGALVPVNVEGVAAYRYRGAVAPRRVEGRALLSPFDPLIWERRRTAWLFGLHYRIGIYTPAAQRTHGYYVLPFLLGDSLVARVDLKADRAAGELQVREAWIEPGAPADTALQLADELREMADWLGTERIRVADRGDLAPALAAAVRRPGPCG